MSSQEGATGSRVVLKLHAHRKQWKGRSGTSDADRTHEFLFTVTPQGGSTQKFWCEVQLKADLLSRPGWSNLSDEDTVKALYCYAVEAIRQSGGRPTRHYSLNWIPGTAYADAPCWDLFKVNLDRPEEVIIDASQAVHHLVVHQK